MMHVKWNQPLLNNVDVAHSEDGAHDSRGNDPKY